VLLIEDKLWFACGLTVVQPKWRTARKLGLRPLLFLNLLNLTLGVEFQKQRRSLTLLTLKLSLRALARFLKMEYNKPPNSIAACLFSRSHCEKAWASAAVVFESPEFNSRCRVSKTKAVAHAPQPQETFEISPS